MQDIAPVYANDLANRTQLIDALNSQRVFYGKNGDYGLTELETAVNPLITMLLNNKKKPASGEYESYIEHRGSWIKESTYYVQASTTTAIAALEANAAVYEGLKLSATAAGAALTANTMQAGDVFVLVDPTDETKYASGLVVSTTAGEMTWRLLTRVPGFDIVANAAGATYVVPVTRLFGEASVESKERYEKPVTFWNEVSIFKESYEISDLLLANKQIVYGDELIFQSRQARNRMMRDVDRGLLYASRRANVATANNPFSAPSSAPVYDANSKRVPSSISLDQAIRAADTVGIGGARLFKLTAATMTPDDVDATITEIFRYGAKSKRCIAGAGAIQALVSMSRKNNQYQMTSGDDAFGLKWKKYVTPIDELNITRHYGMTGIFDNAMFVIDPTNIELRELEGLYTEKLSQNTNSKKLEMRWTIGLRVKLVESHSLVFFN